MVMPKIHVDSSRPPPRSAIVSFSLELTRLSSWISRRLSYPALPTWQLLLTRPQLSSALAPLARPHSALFGLSSTCPATPFFGLSHSPAPLRFSPQWYPPCNAHPSWRCTRISLGTALFSICLSPQTFVFFRLLFLALFSYGEFFFFFVYSHTNLLAGSHVVMTIRTHAHYTHHTIFVTHSARILIHAHILFHIQIGTGTRAVNVTLSLSTSPPCLSPRGPSLLLLINLLALWWSMFHHSCFMVTRFGDRCSTTCC